MHRVAQQLRSRWKSFFAPFTKRSHGGTESNAPTNTKPNTVRWHSWSCCLLKFRSQYPIIFGSDQDKLA